MAAVMVTVFTSRFATRSTQVMPPLCRACPNATWRGFLRIWSISFISDLHEGNGAILGDADRIGAESGGWKRLAADWIGVGADDGVGLGDSGVDGSPATGNTTRSVARFTIGSSL